MTLEIYWPDLRLEYGLGCISYKIGKVEEVKVINMTVEGRLQSV